MITTIGNTLKESENPLKRKDEENIYKAIEDHNLRLLYTFSRFNPTLEETGLREWVKQEYSPPVEDIIQHEENFPFPQTNVIGEQDRNYGNNINKLVKKIERTIRDVSIEKRILGQCQVM